MQLTFNLTIDSAIGEGPCVSGILHCWL